MELKCTQCEKIYKTKSGLSRHMKTKHGEIIPVINMSLETLKQLVNDMRIKTNKNLCYPEVIRTSY